MSTEVRANRGAALLMVLWLSAALSVIAFTVATTVRGETERTSTEVDGIRSYYLATGAIDRALLWIVWGPQYANQDGTPRYFRAPMPGLHFVFPAGVADVEVMPETAKLNINQAQPLELMALMAAIGIPADRAQTIVAGILDWRNPSPGGFTEFDDYYLSIAPTFRARHASFEEIEELMSVRGMTPELFYGRYDRAPDGRLLPRPGLRDCLSVFGGNGTYDVNSVQPAVMQALGIPPETAAAIVAMRPFTSDGQIVRIPDLGPAAGRLGLTQSPVVTLRATAAVRLPNGKLSEMRRSVSAMVAFIGNNYNPPYHILRWYDNAVKVQ